MKNLLYLLIVVFIAQGCAISYPKKNYPEQQKYPKFTPEFEELGALTPKRTCFDVTHYNIYFEAFPSNKSIDAKVVTTATIVSNTKLIQLDLSDRLTINSVINLNTGKELSYNRNYRSIYIELEKEYKAGEQIQIAVSYAGKPSIAKKPPWDGGTVWKTDNNKNPWLGVACESDGASTWLAVKDHESDEADSIDVTITCDTSLTGVSNGTLIETKKLEGGKHQFHWKTVNPINNYNITYYIGNFVPIKDTIHSNLGVVDICHYVLPYNKAQADTHFLEMKEHFRFYEKTFGHYSWLKDGLRMVNSPYSGMEHQSAIAYGNKFKKSWINDQDYIILHETAHEWWGNSISANDLAHVWLHEGFATYAEVLYTEHLLGKEKYEDHMYYNNLSINNKRPVVGPIGKKYFWYKDSDAYNKGSATLHTFRYLLEDDSLFFDIIKSFYTKYERNIIETKDFIEHVNLKTGEDYTWFFNQYLYDYRAPILDLHISFDNIVYYRWRDTNKDFKMPIYILIDKKRYKLNPSNEVKKFEIHNLGYRVSWEYERNGRYYLINDKYEELIDIYLKEQGY